MSLLSALQPIGSLKSVSPAEVELAEQIKETYDSPLTFIKRYFHWGEGDLKNYSGPDLWQEELLAEVERKLKEGESVQAALRFAVASGHGVGKTALVSWIILWFISTRPNSQIVVTANTQSQLSTKTWREVNVWLSRMAHRHWFLWQATKLSHVLFPASWVANAIPWSETNPEAFAGTHETRGVLIVFDEASSIADIIWETVEGALTTAGAMWFCFGNPTRSVGKFYDCFNRFAHRWITYKVDSRKAKVANQAQVNQWVEDYGEDSDFVRVRVRGEFPRQGVTQFIPSDLILEAMKRRINPNAYAHKPVVIGVDVARYGSDNSIIVQRQGQYMSQKVHRFYGIDTMELASRVLDVFREVPNGNAVICVDGVGVGAGVVDRLKERGFPVIDVQSAAKSMDSKTYYNKRSELYGLLKDWLRADGVLPDDKDLFNQLRTLEYQYNNRLQIQLESKEDIRKELGESPDIADALAYTFAYEESRIIMASSRARIVKPVNYG